MIRFFAQALFVSVIQVLQLVQLAFLAYYRQCMFLNAVYIYIYKGPHSMFEPGAPYNLNPPLHPTVWDRVYH